MDFFPFDFNPSLMGLGASIRKYRDVFSSTKVGIRSLSTKS
jgi:hypothetical protein